MLPKRPFMHYGQNPYFFPHSIMNFIEEGAEGATPDAPTTPVEAPVETAAPEQA